MSRAEVLRTLRRAHDSGQAAMIDAGLAWVLHQELIEGHQALVLLSRLGDLAPILQALGGELERATAETPAAGEAQLPCGA